MNGRTKNDTTKNDTTKVARRQRLRARFQILRGSRKFGMIGIPEVVGFVFSGILFSPSLRRIFIF